MVAPSQLLPHVEQAETIAGVHARDAEAGAWRCFKINRSRQRVRCPRHPVLRVGNLHQHKLPGTPPLCPRDWLPWLVPANSGGTLGPELLAERNGEADFFHPSVPAATSLNDVKAQSRKPASQHNSWRRHDTLPTALSDTEVFSTTTRAASKCGTRPLDTGPLLVQVVERY